MEANTDVKTGKHVELTADIVSAYISNNPVPTADLARLIASVHQALGSLGTAAAPASEQATPAQIKKSIMHNGLISFIDGRQYQSLKRHLTAHGLTATNYREKYGLPADYPIVAASYSAKRSALAKSFGLGRVNRQAELRAAATDDMISEVPKSRGRPRKTSTAPAAIAAE